MVTQDRVLGLVILGRSARVMPRRFNAATIALAQALARHAATAIDQAQLKREAIHDPLTNLYNRRHFSERLREEIYRADRHSHATAVLLCDLDRFKAVNDTLGHQVGDQVLREVATHIQASTRETCLNISFADPQHLSCFGDAELLNVAQDQDSAIFLAEGIQRLVQSVAHFLAL